MAGAIVRLFGGKMRCRIACIMEVSDLWFVDDGARMNVLGWVAGGIKPARIPLAVMVKNAGGWRFGGYGMVLAGWWMS